jgi:hypothetical protein
VNYLLFSFEVIISPWLPACFKHIHFLIPIKAHWQNRPI